MNESSSILHVPVFYLDDFDTNARVSNEYKKIKYWRIVEMSRKYEELCKKILADIGGKENVLGAIHCVTRLRITLKDQGLVNQENIKKIKGVLGCQFNSGQFQIIIGQYVGEVCEEFCKLSGINMGASIDEKLDEIPEKFSIKEFINKKIIGTISECVFPILPIFVGAGLIKMLVTILGPNLLDLFSAKGNVLTILTVVGNAGFYYLPIFVAWTAAKKFDTSIPIALFLSSILIHPDFISIVEKGDPFSVFGIPMKLVNYGNQFLPTILMVWILSYVYRYINKFCPDTLKYVLVPLASLLIMLPITLCAVGPLGTYCGIAISKVANWLASSIGPLAVGLIGGLWYFLVGLGMDKALVPVIANQFANFGFDNLFWLSAIFATYALIGVSVAYIFRSKKEERSLGVSNATTLIVGGISEPTIFGCIFRYKKAMAWLFLGGFIGGCLAAILHVKAYTMGIGNILFFTVFAGGDGKSLIPGIICCIVSFLISCILGILFGFSDKVVKENSDSLRITSPVQGKVIELSEVDDPTFSKELIGTGCAILPSKGEVVAPFDGKVETVFPTKHAIGIKRTDGLELMIHIGLNTVNEKGEGFFAKVKDGEEIKKGQTLIDFDLAGLQKKGYDMTTLVIVTSKETTLLEPHDSSEVHLGDTILDIQSKNIVNQASYN